MPTCCLASGSGDGPAHSHEQPTYHLPVRLRRLMAVLGVPSSGRCRAPPVADTHDLAVTSPPRRPDSDSEQAKRSCNELTGQGHYIAGDMITSGMSGMREGRKGQNPDADAR